MCIGAAVEFNKLITENGLIKVSFSSLAHFIFTLLKSLPQHHNLKASVLQCLLYGPTLISIDKPEL